MRLQGFCQTDTQWLDHLHSIMHIRFTNAWKIQSFLFLSNKYVSHRENNESCNRSSSDFVSWKFLFHCIFKVFWWLKLNKVLMTPVWDDSCVLNGALFSWKSHYKLVNWCTSSGKSTQKGCGNKTLTALLSRYLNSDHRRLLYENISSRSMVASNCEFVVCSDYKTSKRAFTQEVTHIVHHFAANIQPLVEITASGCLIYTVIGQSSIFSFLLSLVVALVACHEKFNSRPTHFASPGGILLEVTECYWHSLKSQTHFSLKMIPLLSYLLLQK